MQALNSAKNKTLQVMSVALSVVPDSLSVHFQIYEFVYKYVARAYTTIIQFNSAETPCQAEAII